MNVPLVLFSCQIIIVASQAHDGSDSGDSVGGNSMDLNENTSLGLSSTAINTTNSTRFFGDGGDFSMIKYIPLINIVSTMVEHLIDVIKNQIVFTQTPSSQGGDTSVAFINQTTTECRSESSSGGRNCITKGFTIGGLTTIFVFLGISFGIRIAQMVKDINTMANAPEGFVLPQSLPSDNQLFLYPFTIRPFSNTYPTYGPPMPPQSPEVYKTSNYFIPTIRPTTPHGLHEFYRNNSSFPDYLNGVNRFGRSDERIHDDE